MPHNKSVPLNYPALVSDCSLHRTHLSWCDQDKLLRSDKDLLGLFENKKIVFMGDRMTRYQYLDLAYFLTKKVFTSKQNNIESIYMAR